MRVASRLGAERRRTAPWAKTRRWRSRPQAAPRAKCPRAARRSLRSDAIPSTLRSPRLPGWRLSGCFLRHSAASRPHVSVLFMAPFRCPTSFSACPCVRQSRRAGKCAGKELDPCPMNSFLRVLAFPGPKGDPGGPQDSAKSSGQGHRNRQLRTDSWQLQAALPYPAVDRAVLPACGCILAAWLMGQNPAVGHQIGVRAPDRP